MASLVGATRLSDDAVAILLLCGSFGSSENSEPRPLTVAEYARFSEALRDRNSRPGNLLISDRSAIQEIVSSLPERVREAITADRVMDLLGRGGKLALALDRWSSAGVWIISRADNAYPSRLKKRFGTMAPPILYGIGSPEALEHGGVAIVGSRNTDAESEEYCAAVGRWAGMKNIQVVSGASRGVDELAMLATVANGGTALGVVGEQLLKLSARRPFRESIISRKMTLVSAYDPDSSFSVGRAMGRNRWIYALADRAIVVACEEGKGGTWGGAVEALRRNIVPVYVQYGASPRRGNAALVKVGALRMPDHMDDILSANAREPDSRNALAFEAQGDATTSAYEAVATLIVALLREPMTAKAVSERLDLVKKQADVWLSRLVADGKIVKEKSRFRVLDNKSGGEQPMLFS